MPREEALALARERGLDLVQINAQTQPPIVELTNFDKFRYEKEKEQKRERRLAREKSLAVKQVRISARAAKNDLLIRVRKIEEFFAEGHPVEIMLKLRGREKRNKEWAYKKLNEFLAMIPVGYKTLGDPKWGGFGITLQIAKR